MQEIFLRVISFLVLLILGFSGPWFLFVGGILLYCVAFSGIEVIVLAASVDAYFGFNTQSFYYYTIYTALLLITVQYARPFLKIYDN